MLLKLEEVLGCAKIYTETSPGLGSRRRYCFINSMNLSEAGDLYDRELKMLFLIMKTIIPEVARCFSYLKCKSCNSGTTSWHQCTDGPGGNLCSIG